MAIKIEVSELEALNILRRRNNLSLEKLAKKSRLSTSYLSLIFSGIVARPSQDAIKKITRALTNKNTNAMKHLIKKMCVDRKALDRIVKGLVLNTNKRRL